LEFAHAHENDQLKSISLDDKKLQNWPTLASSCNKENIGEKEDSNSLSNDKGIVHELQNDDIHEDDELSNSSGGIGGQASSSHSEQELITPTVPVKQGRLVCSIGQTGTEHVRLVVQIGQIGSD